ncbi:MAG: hypothetical protein ABGZ53_17955 [Fuerstiella sp.]
MTEAPMTMRYRPFGLLLCGLVAMGCGKGAPEEKASTPQEQLAARKQASVSSDIRTVRLHFDGFTKSKSGAT